MILIQQLAMNMMHSIFRLSHRHIFHFKVWIDVHSNDRDIEFIQFKRWLEKLYSEKTLELDYKSCEMMSDDLFDKIPRTVNRTFRMDWK